MNIDDHQFLHQLKEKIISAVNESRLAEALELLSRYESLTNEDIEIYSIKAVISIMQGELGKAKHFLQEGLSIDSENFDLLYNYAYLHETQKEYALALEYYEKSSRSANEDMKSLVINKLEELRKVKVTPAITIRTWAYNVEKYIDECVASVLNQTFANFEWVILDNGSTDGTSKILEKYAKQDERIILFRNEKNSIQFNVPNNQQYNDYLVNLKSEYYCVLDSDDFLHTDFLKDLYMNAKEHNADIAVAGAMMFKEEDPQQNGIRSLPDFVTHDIRQLGDIFPQIYGCFRPIWGKLIKVSVFNELRKHRLANPLKLLNGGDTIFCLDCLRFSQSVVGINKALYYYRVRTGSHYHTQVDKNRYEDYKIIFHESKKLLEKWGQLTDANLKFIAQVLYSSMKDCMDVAVSAPNVPMADRIEVISTVISDDMVVEIVANHGLFGNFFSDIRKALELIVKNEKPSAI